MPLVTIAALGIAALIGLGNGVVFKLVPQYFPCATGTVTGLVGAAGGLGRFFPPLILGMVKEHTDSFAWGFVILSLYALICLALNFLIFLRRTGPATASDYPGGGSKLADARIALSIWGGVAMLLSYASRLNGHAGFFPPC
jgi:NNP family nitrate/nitrite transporter-like MFS transporter